MAIVRTGALSMVLSRAWRGDRPTVGRFVLDALRPPRAPAGEIVRATVADARMGDVRIAGTLREVQGSNVLFVLVHGLGGSERSTYVLRSARAFAGLGHSTLALNLRGADHSGDDFYNVAMVEDLDAVLAHPKLARFERIHLVGYSMGGYNVLHHARAPRDPRVTASVALCTPLDLKAAQLHFDHSAAFVYRRHVLSGLKAIYAAVAAAGRPVPSDPALVAAVRTVHEWDRLTIAPRYGYDSPEHYYEALSIRPHLTKLEIPVLHVHAAYDPIIPPDTTVLPHLGGGVRLECHRAERSGHLAFEGTLSFVAGSAPGLEPQVAAWCLAR